MLRVCFSLQLFLPQIRLPNTIQIYYVTVLKFKNVLQDSDQDVGRAMFLLEILGKNLFAYFFPAYRAPTSLGVQPPSIFKASQVGPSPSHDITSLVFPFQTSSFTFKDSGDKMGPTCIIQNNLPFLKSFD